MLEKLLHMCEIELHWLDMLLITEKLFYADWPSRRRCVYL